MAVHPVPGKRPFDHRIPRPRCGADDLVAEELRGESSGRVPAQRMAVRLTMMAEAGCSPLWVEDPDGVLNTAPAELPIPAALSGAIDRWAGAFVDTVEPDPAFFDRGLGLAIRLAESLGPACTVLFFDGRDGCLRRI